MKKPIVVGLDGKSYMIYGKIDHGSCGTIHDCREIGNESVKLALKIFDVANFGYIHQSYLNELKVLKDLKKS